MIHYQKRHHCMYTALYFGDMIRAKENFLAENYNIVV